MCFGACEHQHRDSGPRGADYAELLKTCQIRFSSVPERVQYRFSCYLVSEPENFGNCNRSCAEVVQNRVRLSDVCLSDPVYSLLKILLAKRK